MPDDLPGGSQVSESAALALPRGRHAGVAGELADVRGGERRPLGPLGRLGRGEQCRHDGACHRRARLVSFLFRCKVRQSGVSHANEVGIGRLGGWFWLPPGVHDVVRRHLCLDRNALSAESGWAIWVPVDGQSLNIWPPGLGRRMLLPASAEVTAYPDVQQGIGSLVEPVDGGSLTHRRRACAAGWRRTGAGRPRALLTASDLRRGPWQVPPATSHQAHAGCGAASCRWPGGACPDHRTCTYGNSWTPPQARCCVYLQISVSCRYTNSKERMMQNVTPGTEAIISEARKRPALDGQPVSEAAADFMRNAKARNERTQAGKDASCRAAAERVFAFIDAANRP